MDTNHSHIFNKGRLKKLLRNFDSFQLETCYVKKIQPAVAGTSATDIEPLINAILGVLNDRDCYTFDHSLRVTQFADLIARNVGFSQDRINKIIKASYFHDIGKIGVSSEVLKKSSKLSKQEKLDMQAHPTIRYNILSSLPMFEEVADIVLCHHERWDGFGYPKGMKAEDMPLESCIIAVSDTFGAITSNRPYRERQPNEYAIDEILRHKGEQFSPVIVDHLLNILHTIPQRPTHLIKKLPCYLNGHEELMHSRLLSSNIPGS